MDTFERKELKYLLDSRQRELFLQAIAGRVVPAEFPEGDVSSVYYDTPDYLLANRSLKGGTYKEKLRVRSYGQGAGQPVFVELKKKFKGVVYKRRVRCTQAAADAFLAGMDYREAVSRWPLADALQQAECFGFRQLQIAGEIAWMRDRLEGLAPRMRVDVRRTSLVGAEDSQLRLTFDDDARFAPVKGRHGVGAARPLLEAGQTILEVKCAQALPMWLVQALDGCGARPQSVSKYGRAYQAQMQQRLEQVA